MSHLLTRLLLVTSLLGVPKLSLAQQPLDIVQIMGQFVQTHHAVSKCAKPDEKTLARFNTNFRIVTVRATEEMLKRKPGTTEKQVSEVFNKSSGMVEKLIDEVIHTHGCGDPRIQDLLKRFELQASLKL